MEENENLSKAFDKLGEMLSSKDGQKQISDILSMFSGQEQTQEEKSSPEESSGSGFSSRELDMLGTAQKILGVSNKNSQNAAFLEALKPFLKKERQKKLDSAVKMLNAASIFKEMGGFKKGGD